MFGDSTVTLRILISKAYGLTMTTSTACVQEGLPDVGKGHREGTQYIPTWFRHLTHNEIYEFLCYLIIPIMLIYNFVGCIQILKQVQGLVEWKRTETLSNL